ncbi:hypothetical protein AH02_48 [Pseudomonas phage AH02]|nr:hypothetical protein AH02_48 [Pseudomonas phage AH02]
MRRILILGAIDILLASPNSVDIQAALEDLEKREIKFGRSIAEKYRVGKGERKRNRKHRWGGL